MEKIKDLFLTGLTGLFFITMFAAWLTHVIVCFKDDSWGFLIAGALFFPIAMVHGIGMWLGFF